MRTIDNPIEYRGYNIYESEQCIAIKWTFRHKDSADKLSDAYGQTIVECKLQIDIIRLSGVPQGFEMNDVHVVEPAMNIGDIHSNKRGTAARQNAGKTPFDLIPLSALKDAADVFGFGAEKYSAWNWAKGMSWSVPYACMMRHMDAWHRGEENDPESGLPHLGHAMCNMIMLTHFAKFYREGDDRPPSDLFKTLEAVTEPPTYVVVDLASGPDMSVTAEVHSDGTLEVFDVSPEIDNEHLKRVINQAFCNQQTDPGEYCSIINDCVDLLLNNYHLIKREDNKS